jgi:hypothetical protein
MLVELKGMKESFVSYQVPSFKMMVLVCSSVLDYRKKIVKTTGKACEGHALELRPISHALSFATLAFHWQVKLNRKAFLFPQKIHGVENNNV